MARISDNFQKVKKSFIDRPKSWLILLTGLFLWRFGLSLETIYYLGFFLALFWAAWVDWNSGYIYDRLTYPLTAVGLPASILFPAHYEAWWSSAAGAVASWLGMWLLARLGRSAFGKEALGGGDIKLAAAMGAFLGLEQAWKGLLLGALLGLPLMLAFQRARGLSLKDPAPFGPGLCAGAAAVMWNRLGNDLSFLFSTLGT